MAGQHRLENLLSADATPFRPRALSLHPTPHRRPLPHATPPPTVIATVQAASAAPTDAVEELSDDYDDAPALAVESGSDDYSAAGTSSTLGTSAVRGATATLGGQAIRVVLQVVTLVAMARLLVPSDYGLIAEIIAIVGVGELIRDFGLSSAAMQAVRVTRAQRSNLFWINTSIGAGLGVLAFSLAPAIADLYHDPKLLHPAQVIAVTFLMNGMAAQFQADLNRKLRYGRVASSDVGSQLFAFSLAILLALGGAGYWALVAQQVGQAAAALLILVVLDDWRPGRPSRNSGMREFWSYGWGLMGTQLLGYATRNIDSIVIGYRFGASPLGIYERAFQVLMLPLNQINAPITRVALPVLARLQHTTDQFRAYLFRGQTVLTNVTVAVFSFGAALGGPLFDLVFGHRWHAAVPLFQILALGGMFQAVSYPAYWAFLAKGLTRTNLYSALLSRPLVATGIIVGSNWGVRGVAVGYTIGLFTVWPIEMIFIHRNTDVNGWALFGRGLRPLTCWLSVAALTYLLVQQLHLAAVAAIGAGALSFVGAAAVLAALVPAFRRDLMIMRDTFGMLRGPSAVTGAGEVRTANV